MCAECLTTVKQQVSHIDFEYFVYIYANVLTDHD